MLNKISSMLDAVADSLESKGCIKEAYEVDKVADKMDKISVVHPIAPGMKDPEHQGISYVVTYKDALDRTGEIHLYAQSPEDAKQKVNHMLSADLGGHAIKVDIDRSPKLYP